MILLHPDRSFLLGAAISSLSVLVGCEPPAPPRAQTAVAPSPTVGPEDSSPEPAAPPAAGSEWKVGAYLSLSGPEAQFGIDTREGIELAVDDVNERGGVKGQPIRVIVANDASNPAEASAQALRLIEQEKVVALLGTTSSARSRAGGIVANQKGIPMITPSSTHPDVTKVGPFVFRTCFIDPAQGRAAARFVVNVLGKKNLAILYSSDLAYSSFLATEFRDEARKLGARMVTERPFLQTETNFAPHLKDIKARKADIVYVPVYYNHMAPIARQAKADGILADKLVGGDGWDGMAAEDLVHLEGAYMTGQYAADNPAPRVQDFVKKYKARYQRDPNALAATGHDAAAVLADAIQRAKGASPDDIREAIGQTTGFPGVTGEITIDADRNADKPVVVHQIKGATLRFHSVIQP